MITPANSLRESTTIAIASLCIMILCVPMPGLGQGNVPAKLLIFTKANDYVHESTAGGVIAITDLCRQHGIEADATDESEWFTKARLEEYGAVMFINTSGDVFNESQQNAFRDYIRSGRGFVGVHGASTTEYDWEWFGKMIGGYFAGHPEPQQATLIIHDTTHVSTRRLPKIWKHFDEWYNFRWVDQKFNLLLSVDEATYTGGRHKDHHPISWYKSFDGGRVFYTALGHTEECYSDEHFLNHVLGGVFYALGKSPKK